MAIVHTLKHQALERDSSHTETECTYAVVRTAEGAFLQVDTYGSKARKEPGKKSQSIRFSPEAIEQLKRIFASEL